MKIFYFIMAHRLPEQAGMLARALVREGDEVCIHVDRKVDWTPFLRAAAGSGAQLMSNRRSVSWGGFSQVLCLLDGIRRFEKSGCDYFVALSGQDFPIKPVSALRNHLVRHNGHCFMDIRTAEQNWGPGLSRLRVHYFVDFWSALKNRVPGAHTLINKAEGLFNRVQALFVKRKFRHGVLYGGSSWFALPAADAAFILKEVKERGRMVRFFRTCISPDEMFFHTLLGSRHAPSHFLPSLTYARFRDGKRNPEVLVASDMTMLRERPEFFARKFDQQVDAGILKELQKLNG
jgi:hypothetical protein